MVGLSLSRSWPIKTKFTLQVYKRDGERKGEAEEKKMRTRSKERKGEGRETEKQCWGGCRMSWRKDINMTKIHYRKLTKKLHEYYVLQRYKRGKTKDIF